jgi:hypothetical protein
MDGDGVFLLGNVTCDGLHPGEINRRRPKVIDQLDEFPDKGGKICSLAGAQVVHPHPFTLDADAVKDFRHPLDPGPSPEITGLIMTIALKAACNHNPVRPVFKGLQQVGFLYSPRAGQSEDAGVRWIPPSLRAGQVGCGVGTPLAGK